MATSKTTQKFNPDQALIEVELGHLARIFKEAAADPDKALTTVALIKRAGLNNGHLPRKSCEKIEGAADLVSFRLTHKFFTGSEHLSKRVDAALNAYDNAYKFFGRDNTAPETELGLVALALLEEKAQTNPDFAHTHAAAIWDKCSRKKDSPLWEAVNLTLVRMAEIYMGRGNLEKAAGIISDVLAAAEQDKNEILATAAKTAMLHLAERTFHRDDGCAAAFDTVRTLWQDAPARSELRATAKKIMTNWQFQEGTTEFEFEAILALG